MYASWLLYGHGEAVKAEGSECYTYDISKFKLYQRQGLNINISVEDTIKLIRAGSPPFVQQVPKPLMDLWLEMQRSIES